MKTFLFAILAMASTVALAQDSEVFKKEQERQIQAAELDFVAANTQIDTAEKACAELRRSGDIQSSDADCLQRLRLAANRCAAQEREKVRQTDAAEFDRDKYRSDLLECVTAQQKQR